MNPYLKFVEQVESAFAAAKQLPLGGIESCAETPLRADAPKALIFAPHPDDECITGLLPLRLMREAGLRIINVPVTFGSNKDRQSGRAEELKNACDYLGFQCLEKIAGRNAVAFQGLEKTDVVEILKAEQPSVLFVPHSKDWNSRHIATHFLVMDALQEMQEDFSCTVIETEFWGAMDDPNLMVEGNTETVADLVAALSFHVKEVERNPYHLSLPAWMQDNVRRGGELVGGQGGIAPDFTFATLYRISRWENRQIFQWLGERRMLSMEDNPNELLQEIFKRNNWRLT